MHYASQHVHESFNIGWDLALLWEFNNRHIVGSDEKTWPAVVLHPWPSIKSLSVSRFGCCSQNKLPLSQLGHLMAWKYKGTETSSCGVTKVKLVSQQLITQDPEIKAHSWWDLLNMRRREFDFIRPFWGCRVNLKLRGSVGEERKNLTGTNLMEHGGWWRETCKEMEDGWEREKKEMEKQRSPSGMPDSGQRWKKCILIGSWEEKEWPGSIKKEDSLSLADRNPIVWEKQRRSKIQRQRQIEEDSKVRTKLPLL